ISACQYLADSEGAGEKRENLIPEEKRSPKPEQLKHLGVKEACVGVYKSGQGDGQVLQGVGVYISGKNAWILIQNVQRTAFELHSKTLGDIARSFITH